MLGQEWTRHTHTCKVTRRSRKGIQRWWNKVALSITWVHTDIPPWNHTIQTRRSRPQSTTAHSPSARQQGSRFLPSRKKVAATNSTVRKLLNKQNSGKTNTNNHNTMPLHPPFADSPLLRPTSPGALSSVVHDGVWWWHRNLWWHPPAVGTVATKVQMQKPVTYNNWWTGRNSVCRIKTIAMRQLVVS